MHGPCQLSGAPLNGLMALKFLDFDEMPQFEAQATVAYNLRDCSQS